MLVEISPISDIRSSAEYRTDMVATLLTRCFETLNRDKDFSSQVPSVHVTLEGKNKQANETAIKEMELIDNVHPIETMINGKAYQFFGADKKSLLDLIRENAGLIGTKEGCNEGECGACTVFLDGKAVMACLVPAARAHKAEITTIEGLSSGSKLHKVQEAFIEQGAVQCGYCTPGFVMSAAKLLEEIDEPTENQIKEAITGNLCRCTGYYKIIKAIELAAIRETR